MANDYQYVVKVHYAEAVQENINKTLISMDLAGMIDIPNGTTKNLPLVQMRSTGDYIKYTDQVITDVDTSNDQIAIDTTPMVNFAMDDLDEDDNYINIKPDIISDAWYAIKKRIDWDFFAEALNAKWKYDANGFGVNSGTLSPVTLTTWASQNISATFGNAKAWLTNTGVNGDKLALCVDSFTTVSLATLWLEAGYNIADVSYTRGFQGMFGWMSTYEASTLYSSTSLATATLITAWDFIYIQGVKFLAVADGTAANPWEFSLTWNAAAVTTILTNALNGAGTPWVSTYIEVSSDDRARLEWVTATDATTSITIINKWGAMLATSDMTTGANDFTAQVLNTVIMEKGAIKMALRPSVSVKSAREPLKLVTNYFIYARYGLKTTTRGAEKMCIIPLVSKAAEA